MDRYGDPVHVELLGRGALAMRRISAVLFLFMELSPYLMSNGAIAAEQPAVERSGTAVQDILPPGIHSFQMRPDSPAEREVFLKRRAGELARNPPRKVQPLPEQQVTPPVAKDRRE